MNTFQYVLRGYLMMDKCVREKMSDSPKHCFDEYIVQGEASQKQRAAHWQIAIGLQDVDRLKNSPYLLDTARQHIEGTLDLAAGT